MVDITELGDVYNNNVIKYPTSSLITDRSTSDREYHSIYCPYCNGLLILNNTTPKKRTKFTYIHPVDYSIQKNKIKKYMYKSRDIFQCIDGDSLEVKLKCLHCNNFFHLQLIPFDDTTKNSYGLHIIDILTNNVTIDIDNNPLFIKLLKNKHFSTLIWLLPSLLFFIPALFFYLIGKANNVFSLYEFLMVAFIILSIYLLSFYFKNLEKYLDYDGVPLRLNKNYLNSASYKLFKQLSLRGRFYNVRYSIFNRSITTSNSEIISIIIGLVSLTLFISPILNSNVIYGLYNQIISVRSNVILLLLIYSIIAITLLSLLGLVLLCFLFGFILIYMFCIALDSIKLIYSIVLDKEIKIDLLQESGGLLPTGNLILSTLYIVLPFIVLFIFVNATSFISNDIMPLYITQKLSLSEFITKIPNLFTQQVFSDHNILLTFISLTVFYIIVLPSIFLTPILIIYFKLKKSKNDRLKDIENQMRNFCISESKFDLNECAANTRLNSEYNIIRLMNEWPIHKNWITSINLIIYIGSITYALFKVIIYILSITR